MAGLLVQSYFRKVNLLRKTARPIALYAQLSGQIKFSVSISVKILNMGIAPSIFIPKISAIKRKTANICIRPISVNAIIHIKQIVRVYANGNYRTVLLSVIKYVFATASEGNILGSVL